MRITEVKSVIAWYSRAKLHAISRTPQTFPAYQRKKEVIPSFGKWIEPHNSHTLGWSTRYSILSDIIKYTTQKDTHYYSLPRERLPVLPLSFPRTKREREVRPIVHHETYTRSHLTKSFNESARKRLRRGYCGASAPRLCAGSSSDASEARSRNKLVFIQEKRGVTVTQPTVTASPGRKIRRCLFREGVGRGSRA